MKVKIDGLQYNGEDVYVDLGTMIENLQRQVNDLDVAFPVLEDRVTALEAVEPEPPAPPEPEPLPEATYHIYPPNSIENAIAKLKPGDILEVHGGTYNEQVEPRDIHGTEDSSIIIRAAAGEAPIIKSVDWVCLDVSGCSYLVFEGFEFTGARYDGVYITDSHHITVGVCESYGNGGVGIHILSQRGPASHNLVYGCEVHDNGAEGIYLDVKTENSVPVEYNVISGNHIHDNRYEGIQNTHQDGNGLKPNYTKISNNLIENNGTSWATLDLSGKGLIVVNNTVTNTKARAGGIWCGGMTYGLVSNNTVDNKYYSYVYGDAISINLCANLTVEDNVTSGVGASGIGITVKNSTDITMSGNVHN